MVSDKVLSLLRSCLENQLHQADAEPTFEQTEWFDRSISLLDAIDGDPDFEPDLVRERESDFEPEIGR